MVGLIDRLRDGMRQKGSVQTQPAQILPVLSKEELAASLTRNFNHPDVQAALRKKAEEGLPLTAVIHYEMPDIFRELAAEGLMRLFYSPRPVKQGQMVFDRNVVLQAPDDVLHIATNTWYLYDMIQAEQRQQERDEYFLIPSAGVETVYQMIKEKRDPVNIRNYLVGSDLGGIR